MRFGLYCLKTGNSVPLKKITVKAEIGASIAHVQSKLVYFNDSDDPVEANFTFPLDDESAVYKFEAEINQRTIVAEVQERNQARETYKDAVESGNTAILLEEHPDSGDVFKCRLGNLPGKEPAILTIAHVSELPHDGDALRFTLPTVLNPRYGSESTPMAPALSGFYSGQPAGPMVCINPGSYSLVLDLDIQSPTKIEKVFSESDQIQVDYGNDNCTAHVNLQFGENVHLDHDITVLYSCEDMHRPQAIVERGLQNGGGIMKHDVVMMDFFPEIEENYTCNGEYIFIIDRSGSMDLENRMERARETMILLLKSLPVGCHFNIYSFGNYYHILFDQGSPLYDQNSLDKALEYVQTMEADMGGTEILKPLQDMYSRLSIAGHPKQVFLLTDGQVWNVKEVCDLVRSHADTTRVFSVGIGEGASTALVKGLARAANGKAVFVKGTERLQHKVVTLLNCAMQPTVRNVSVSWELPLNVSAYTLPQNVSQIFFGDKVFIYALLNGSENMETISGVLTLQGQINDTVFSHKLAFTGQGQTGDNEASLPVHRLAAKAIIQEIEDIYSSAESQDQQQINEKDKEKIIFVSVGSNIISRHTSFVGVDKESKVPIKHCVGQYPQQLAVFGSTGGGGGQSYGMFGSKPLTGSMPASSFTFGATAPSSNLRAQPASLAMGFGGASLFSMKTQAPIGGFGQTGGMGQLGGFGQSGSMSGNFGQSAGMSGGFNQPGGMSGGFGQSVGMSGGFGFSGGVSQSAGLFGAKLVKEKLDHSESQKQQDSMMSVVLLQQFQGCWELNQKLSDTIKIPLATLKLNSPIPQNESVWATCLCLAWLKLNYSKNKAEWKIIETKAMTWLRNQHVRYDNIEAIITMAESVLKK